MGGIQRRLEFPERDRQGNLGDDLSKLDALTSVIKLSQVVTEAPAILAGRVRGRMVVDVNA